LSYRLGNLAQKKISLTVIAYILVGKLCPSVAFVNNVKLLINEYTHVNKLKNRLGVIHCTIMCISPEY